MSNQRVTKNQRNLLHEFSWIQRILPEWDLTVPNIKVRRSSQTVAQLLTGTSTSRTFKLFAHIDSDAWAKFGPGSSASYIATLEIPPLPEENWATAIAVHLARHHLDKKEFILPSITALAVVREKHVTVFVVEKKDMTVGMMMLGLRKIKEKAWSQGSLLQ